MSRFLTYAAVPAAALVSQFLAPDGSRTVAGQPIHLISSAGTTLLDAGRVRFDDEGNVVSVNGPHPFLDADLAELVGHYCPS